MIIDGTGMEHKQLNIQIQNNPHTTIKGLCGQRFIAAGISNRQVVTYGTPGNALGAYLNGASIVVHGNAQDAVGDTMNDGEIIIYGNVGDAVGYAMRGGKIFIKGNAGYRAGIHMKAYEDKIPIMIIGGSAGSFLGEYQAGGIIVVLGLSTDDRLVHNFPCTGMHGGKVFLRGEPNIAVFPPNVCVSRATDADILCIKQQLIEFCNWFDYDATELLQSTFSVVTPNHDNPFHETYVTN